MEIERRTTPNQAAGRDGHRPRAIVLHTTAGSYESTVGWFADAASGVSAHYLVGLDGRVAQFVDEENTARHAGRVRDPSARVLSEESPNLYTIGIEFEDGGDPAGVRRTDQQYIAGARLLAGVAARWEIPLDREHLIGHREVFAAKSCPGNLDLDRLARDARREESLRGRGPLVCLLPARNAAEHLPGWLASVDLTCDAVVALDDGSTDATCELLEASPLVRELLVNPRRGGYRGWDDAANRNRLLEAAAALEPGWIVSLDADERLDPGDALALRELVAGDALGACAYGFRHYRMWGDGRYDPRFSWIYRLFAFRPGQRFPDQRLHFNPIPTAIPRQAWVRTTIRVRHLAADSEERLAARLRKYREADPEAEYATDFGGLSERPDGGLPAWRERPQGLPALGWTAAGPAPAAPPGGRKLVCLLPARDCEQDLPGWLESVRRFADAVVALDDGSGDRTAELLEHDPLVEVLLRNPRRAGYAGWDDLANRNRLLEVAAALQPDWIVSLDADERLDPDDAAALRRLVDGEALPGFAYGFRVFRMIGPGSWDRAGLVVYRLFAYEPGQRFAGDRLHFVPVPNSVGRDRWLETTIRIQHLASVTEERRRARFEKYVAADPVKRFQRDYSNLIAEPGPARPWEPRPIELPLLAIEAAERDELERLDLEGPVLSAIVISRDDEDRIERVVGAVAGQECPQPFEVIVVTSGTDRTAAIVRERFPGVRLVALGRPALPGEARNAGLRVARGDYVSFPGSHVELPPGSLAARLRAHEDGHAMVTGSTLNGTRTVAGWASYFLDHSGSLPGRPSGPLGGPPAHCSYMRHLLDLVGGFREDMRAGEDTLVNRELVRLGYRAQRASDVTLVHASPCRRPARLLRHHFTRGRAMGRIVLDDHRERGVLRGGMPRGIGRRYVTTRLRRTSANVERWGGDLRRRYRLVYPLVVAGALAAWVGCWYELLRPARGKARALLGPRGGRPSRSATELAAQPDP